YLVPYTDALPILAELMRQEAAKNDRKVGIYALFQLVLAETDAEALKQCEAIVAGADHGAINNILASAAMDTNPGGTAAQLKEGLTANFEDGNLARMLMMAPWSADRKSTRLNSSHVKISYA